MQSMEILIVICRVRNRGSLLAGGRMHAASGRMPAGLCEIQNDGVQAWFAAEDKEKAAPRQKNTLHRFHDTENTRRRLLVVLGLQDFATTVETVRADVVTQVRLASGRLDRQVRRDEEIVRTVHAALRWGLLILLNCHDDS
jgi:hypothetical protein